MSVTKERFEQGMTYEAYKAQMTRNQERFATNERQLVLDPADVEAFKQLAQPLNVLVLAEDWCTDVIDNLPILGHLAEESGKLNVRIFLRDQNLDLMEQYLKEGKFQSIPVFAFFDEDFHEIGRFIERPESVTERLENNRREIFAQHPEFGDANTPISQIPEAVRVPLMQAMMAARAKTKVQDNQEVVQALRAIVESAAA